MKRGRLFLFGSFLAVFLMVMVPNISAVEYNIAEKMNKEFLSRETHRLINRSRGFKGLFHIVSRSKDIDFSDINFPLNINLFVLMILITGVIIPTIILLIGEFLEDLLGSDFTFSMGGIVLTFIFSFLMLLTEHILEWRYGSVAYSLCALFILIDALIAAKIYDLIRSLYTIV